MARENQLWAWLKRAQLHYLEDLHMHRVENSVGRSMPDVEGHLRGCGQFWIELKSTARPSKPTTKVRFKFQDGQPEWLERRWNLGGCAWLLCQVGSGAERRIYMFPGSFASSVASGCTEASLQRFDALQAVRPAPEDAIRVAAHRE